MFTKESLAELKERTSIADVIAYTMPSCLTCPICDHHGCFLTNPQNTHAQCLKCEWKGDSVALLMRVFSYSFERTCEEIAKIYEIQLEKVVLTEDQKKDLQANVKTKIVRHLMNLDETLIKYDLIEYFLKNYKE